MESVWKHQYVISKIVHLCVKNVSVHFTPFTISHVHLQCFQFCILIFCTFLCTLLPPNAICTVKAYRNIYAINIPQTDNVPSVLYLFICTLCAYNLIRIKEDEWKMAFHTTRGHYEYALWVYQCLSCVPSIYKWDLQGPSWPLYHCIHWRYSYLLLEQEGSYSTCRHSAFPSASAPAVCESGKCEFQQNSINSLGYIISESGNGFQQGPFSNGLAITHDCQEVTAISVFRQLLPQCRGLSTTRSPPR